MSLKNTIDYLTCCATDPRNNHGIGDQVVAFHVIRALVKKHPKMRIRMVIVGETFQWARLGWHDVEMMNEVLEPGVQRYFQNDNPAWFRDDIEAEKKGMSRVEYTADRFNCREFLTPLQLKVPEYAKQKDEEIFVTNFKKSLPNVAERYRPRILFAPFATARIRQWPLRHWHRLHKMLWEKGFAMVTAVGDRDLEFLKQAPGMVLVKRAPLEMAAAISNSKLVIGGDTGMVHLASAYGVPSIALQGPTNCNVVFGYYTPKPHVMQSPLKCSPCSFVGKDIGPHCMTDCGALHDISPEAVFEKAMEILKDANALPNPSSVAAEADPAGNAPVPVGDGNVSPADSSVRSSNV